MAARRVRPATEDDAQAVQAIYGPEVAATPISFEADPPSVDEMRERICETLRTHPWLVCEEAGRVLGYAYASAHRTRAAYRWSVDVSVYIACGARRSGVGRALYGSLFRVLARQGFYMAYAGITLPNPGSVGLHEALGFTPIGVYEAVGYKLGAWHAVGWWGLELRPRPASPAPPVPLPAVDGWESLL